jgi:hypothetical protein
MAAKGLRLAIGGFPLFALIFDVDFSKPGRGIEPA